MTYCCQVRDSGYEGALITHKVTFNNKVILTKKEQNFVDFTGILLIFA